MNQVEQLRIIEGADYEQWLPVVGFEGIYEVSSMGSVRRIKRSCGGVVGKILRNQLKGKYPGMTLYRDRKPFSLYLHVLVAETFHGIRPIGKEVNHKDGDKTNNRADNLEWVTPLENIHHAMALGLTSYKAHPGEENGRAVLSAEQVREIRRMKGFSSQRNLAKQFGVSKATIQFIHSGKSWKIIE